MIIQKLFPSETMNIFPQENFFHYMTDMYFPLSDTQPKVLTMLAILYGRSLFGDWVLVYGGPIIRWAHNSITASITNPAFRRWLLSIWSKNHRNQLPHPHPENPRGGSGAAYLEGVTTFTPELPSNQPPLNPKLSPGPPYQRLPWEHSTASLPVRDPCHVENTTH